MTEDSGRLQSIGWQRVGHDWNKPALYLDFLFYKIIDVLIPIRKLPQVKEESEKAGLKLNIQKTKIMASGPITSWQIGGETMKTVRDFIFFG